MHTNKHTIEDFLSNPSFVKWVKDPDAETERHWEEWLKQHPAKQQEMMLARQLLLSLAYRNQYTLPQTDVDEIFAKIQETQAYTAQQPQRMVEKVIPFLGRFWWAAASVAVVGFFLGMGKGTQRNLLTKVISLGKTEYQETAKGERRKVVLPDGTIVTLQAQSSLEFPSAFTGNIREVKLEGEAFFEVVKNPHKPFVVKSKHLETKVLGTSFDVIDRANQAQGKVAVVTGKVQMSVPKQGIKQMLTPNLMGVWQAKQQAIEAQPFDPKEMISWKSNILYFSKTPLKAVFEQLEMWYGVSIEIAPNTALKGRYSGEFYDETLENVLTGIAFTSGFSYEIDGDHVRIMNSSNTQP